jgi:RNA polymerase sigma-70 factor (family 1)
MEKVPQQGWICHCCGRIFLILLNNSTTTITDYSSYTDGELVKFLREGNTDAFTEIYHRYNKSVYRYLEGLVKVPQLAEDLVHEVFLRLWEARGKLDIRGSFSGYLFRICHNQAYDAILHLSRERHLLTELLFHYQLRLTEEAPGTPAELRKVDQLVEQALDSLPPQRRRVYELCKQQGKTYQQAADELGITPNTVKEHITKALATLRLFLQNKGRLGVLIYLGQFIFKKS